METLYSEAINKIKANKKKLEKALNVKISVKGKDVCVSGKAVDEYIACQIIEALNLGFNTNQGLLLRDENFVFEKINIKDVTKRHDLERIRGRIIGTKGKTKEIIENLSDCFISLHDNTVGIIGEAENIERAMQAITSIIQGSKQSKVYSSLERDRTKTKQEEFKDLGLEKGVKEKP